MKIQKNDMVKKLFTDNGNIKRCNEPIVLNCLEGIPHNIENIKKIDARQSWIVNNNGLIGKVYLTHIAKMLFNIQRLPFWKEEFQYGFESCNNATDFFNSLTSAIYKESLADLDRLYTHTQELLKSAIFDGYFKADKSDGYIKLKRGVSGCYAAAIAIQAQSARKSNLKSIQINTAILSSYAFKSAYARDLEFSVNVPISDILICSQTVAFSGNKSDLRTPYDEEYIVINKDERGLLEVNLDDIIFEDCVTQKALERGNFYELPRPDYYQKVKQHRKIDEPKIVQLAWKICNFWRNNKK